ncbi:hypothetical protein IGK61_001849 [Enterococcus sp. AZ063]|uniref:hypothetical protein n=2 Tax=Enterococcus TaxID=1350 RepID=UPI000353EB63|nr:hypothetical protein [Enterococcus faecium]EPH92107.1 hypothetical protein D922_02521 [Enterococcus faecalis 06-MB-DW-09]OTO04255.1 hypothetical protein A5883_001241 [Enterococcus sp. 5B3_DIV0040]
MNTHQMQFGWTIEAPKYLSILTNKNGLVAIVSEYATFGDNQSLLITLSETSAEVAVTPHYISSLTISTEKKIKIATSPFYEQQMVEIEKMNSDSQITD